MKKELDTVRSLNDTFRNQISKGEMEKKKLASEKKEIEKECKDMKLKTTSLEAQLLLYQETLEQKEELQRLCNQYLSKIQDYKKKLCDNVDLQRENDQYRNQINEYDSKNKKFETIICEKNKEMMKLLKVQNKNNSQIKTLTKQCEECDYQRRLSQDLLNEFAKHHEANYIDEEESERLHRKEMKELNRKMTRCKEKNPDL